MIVITKWNNNKVFCDWTFSQGATDRGSQEVPEERPAHSLNGAMRVVMKFVPE